MGQMRLQNADISRNILSQSIGAARGDFDHSCTIFPRKSQGMVWRGYLNNTAKSVTVHELELLSGRRFRVQVSGREKAGQVFKNQFRRNLAIEPVHPVVSNPILFSLTLIGINLPSVASPLRSQSKPNLVLASQAS